MLIKNYEENGEIKPTLQDLADMTRVSLFTINLPAYDFIRERIIKSNSEHDN